MASPSGEAQIGVRKVSEHVAVMDVSGDLTAEARGALMSAYEQASSGTTTRLILNFAGLQYLNSFGAGLLVQLAAQATRRGQQLLSYGVNEHYKQVFALTRLDRRIRILGSEAAAISAATSA